MDTVQTRLISLTALASDYCGLLEQAAEQEKDDFIRSAVSMLPRIYWEFTDIEADEDAPADLAEGFLSGPEYMEEDYYESIRRHVEMLLGEDDTFLETFEQDMKYSDTPIAASISECLADIFQPLYNFVMRVRESDGDQLAAAFLECQEAFREYWSQTLCNVMRALNHLRYGS